MEVLQLMKSITWHLSLEAGSKDTSAGSVGSITELPKMFAISFFRGLLR